MRWIALVALVVGCGDDDANQPSGMIVTVQRWNAAQACFADHIGVTDPELGLGIEPCAAIATPILAGVDTLRIVIDYGTGLRISDATVLPDPAIAVTFDGQPSTATPRLGHMQRAEGHAFFLATYDVPLAIASEARITAEAVADYRDEVQPFAVILPTPTIRIQNCAVGCVLTGGATTATVEVTVPSRTAQPVTLRTSLDDVASGTTRDITTEVTGEATTTKVTTIDVPLVDKPSRWKVTATWLTQNAPVEIDLAAPEVEISVAQCPSETCTLTAAVGTASVSITVPGEAPQPVSVRSILNNVLQSESSTFNTASIGQQTTRATTTIDVPIATTNAKWVLEAVWRTRTARTREIDLQPPVISASLGCDPCILTAGTSVVLTVRAPKDIRTSTAQFTSLVGANTDVLNGTITQLTTDEVLALKVWRSSLTVPNRPGETWVIQAAVAGYPAQTLTGLITTAPP